MLKKCIYGRACGAALNGPGSSFNTFEGIRAPQGFVSLAMFSNEVYDQMPQPVIAGLCFTAMQLFPIKQTNNQ